MEIPNCKAVMSTRINLAAPDNILLVAISAMDRVRVKPGTKAIIPDKLTKNTETLTLFAKIILKTIAINPHAKAEVMVNICEMNSNFDAAKLRKPTTNPPMAAANNSAQVASNKMAMDRAAIEYEMI